MRLRTLPGRSLLAGASAGATLVAALAVSTPHGVYWSDTDVFFLAPSDEQHSNTYAYTTDSVIATAGLIGHLVQPTGTEAGLGAQTTLVAQGTHDGSRVELPHSGGQWEITFDKPLLDVQVVGSTPAEVARRTAEVVDEIRSAAGEVQAGVAPEHRMLLSPTPAQAQVHYSTGDPRRAVLGVLLLGGLLGTALVRWAGRRPSRRDRGITEPSQRSAHRDLGRGLTDERLRTPAGVVA